MIEALKDEIDAAIGQKELLTVGNLLQNWVHRMGNRKASR